MRTHAMSTSTTRASMASTASSSTTRAGAFGRRVGEATGSRAGARRGPRVPAGAGRARPAHRPRVSVVTYALAGADDADVSKDASAPRRLKIFSVNDGASPREARDVVKTRKIRSRLANVRMKRQRSRARDRTSLLVPETDRRDARRARVALRPETRISTRRPSASRPRASRENVRNWRTNATRRRSFPVTTRLSVLTFSPFQKNGKQCTSSRTSPP